ncbi:uncharacterized protein LOC135426754 [Drosophila montana]|uniref:uncharacterized protein LOC135426754 n=1 Tax=Drosophila montana TaxID=40370 RepID=UPI00313C4016
MEVVEVTEAAPRSNRLRGLRDSLVWFFSLPAVQYAQVSVVVLGDLLALSSLYPSHSMYIARPFLIWKY